MPKLRNCDRAELQVRPEIVNDVQHLVTEAPQENERGHKPFEDVRFIDRYIEGKSHFLIHLRSLKGGEYIACFHRELGWIRSGERVLLCGKSHVSDDRLSGVERGFLAWSHGAANIYRSNGQQQTMLIHDIQSMQLPEPMTYPSLVWLDTVERFIARLPKAWYISLQGVSVLVGSIEDWEGRVIFGLPARNSDQRVSQMIERASQIVESVPQHEGQVIVDGGDILDVKTYLAGLDVILSPDGVWIGAPKFADSGFKMVNVLLGPIVFC